MKTIFAHDHIFYTKNQNVYSNGGLSSEVLNRYVKSFGKIQVLARQEEISGEVKNLTLSTTNDVEFIKIPNFKSVKNITKKIEAKKIIEKEIKTSDFVIARLPSSIGYLSVKYAKKHRIPYLIEVVGCVWDAYFNYGSLLGKVMAPFAYIGTGKMVYNSQYVIYITKFFLQKRYPTKGKMVICPNVNISEVKNYVLENRIKKIKNNVGVVKFGLIGSLDVDYKGHETVIKSLGIIKEQIPDFKVEFLGKGDSSRWLPLIKENGLLEKVSFIGTVPSGKDVYDWIDQIDIMLQPSYAEAQGRSIIESMSRACPVIASKVGGIVELISSSWLIRAGDFQDLSQKIINLLSSEEYLITEANRNFFEAQEYLDYIIEKKRSDFFEIFKEENKG